MQWWVWGKTKYYTMGSEKTTMGDSYAGSVEAGSIPLRSTIHK